VTASQPSTGTTPEAFAIARGPAGEVLVYGEVDLATSPALRVALADTPGSCVVDLTNATYLDSTGVSALYEYAHRGMQILVREHTAVATVVRICGLPNIATVHAV
jgi:anti-anti-sigma factor